MRKNLIFSRDSSKRGVALILTLGILVLVTLLVVAFAVSMRVENSASKNFNDLIKARLIAQAAIDQAVATIRGATPAITNIPPSPTAFTTYTTAPGVIYTRVNGQPWTTTPLFTPESGLGNVDINSNNWITGQDSDDIFPPDIAGASALMVGWSNITANVNGTVQIVGRFAYWVDDESAKVNLNVAGTRGNDIEGASPEAIDLGQLLNFTASDVINVSNYVATVRPFDTVESVKMVMAEPPSTVSSIYSNNQFYMTVNSVSPDITPWGSKRLNLSNVVANAASKAAAVTQIANALSDPNLTSMFGQTFGDKYNAQQVAANIVDYISNATMPTDSGSGPLDTTAPTYLGLKQTPYLNELVISNAFTESIPSSVGGQAQLTINTSIMAELWYMYTNNTWNPGVAQLPKVVVSSMPSMTIHGGGIDPTTVPSPFPAGPATINANASMATNSYAVYTNSSLGLINLAVNDTTTPIIVTFNASTAVAIYSGQKGRMDYAQIPFTQHINPLVIPPFSGPGAVSTNFTWAAQCNDPRVKPISNTWLQNNGTSTLGLPNSTTNMAVVTGVIQGDGDMSCHIISGSNQRGTMYPGELSYIHTGVPWRTFWLQPQMATEATTDPLPDWAILDLFSATDVTNVVGRMSINATTTNGDILASPIYRKIPLQALLTNSLPQNSYRLANAVQNIYSYAYLANDRVDSLSSLPNFSPYSYTMVGEVANTQSLSNTHTFPVGSSNKRNQETPVRDIANIITTRSDTFTIWCLAQSIKKVDVTQSPTLYLSNITPPDLITGEVKMQVIVQRYEDDTIVPPSIKFRTLYYRYYYQ